MKNHGKESWIDGKHKVGPVKSGPANSNRTSARKPKMDKPVGGSSSYSPGGPKGY